MADRPSQLDVQQQHARSVAAGDLEMLGKRASASWSAGQHKTLGEAVVESVKLAGLSPEQVRRVVEFANTDAFLDCFHKLGSGHRYVDFGHGVLADPREVLRDLNDGGGGAPQFNTSTADYDGPPADKTAQAHNPEAELAMWAAFDKQAAGDLQIEDPNRFVWDERDKLAGATQHLLAALNHLEVAYQDCALELYGQVKQAALEGVDLGQVVQAWSSCTDEPVFIKAAFQVVAPRLLADRLFDNIDQLNRSIEKTGMAHLVNQDHPLVRAFADYVDVLSKTADIRQQYDREANKLAQLNHVIANCKDTNKLAGAVMGAFKGMGDAAREALEAAGHPGLGHLAAGSIKAAPVVGALVGSKVLYDTAATHPAVAAINSRVNPASTLYQQRKQYRRDLAMQQALS